MDAHCVEVVFTATIHGVHVHTHRCVRRRTGGPDAPRHAPGLFARDGGDAPHRRSSPSSYNLRANASSGLPQLMNVERRSPEGADLRPTSFGPNLRSTCGIPRCVVGIEYTEQRLLEPDRPRPPPIPCGFSRTRRAAPVRSEGRSARWRALMTARRRRPRNRANTTTGPQRVLQRSRPDLASFDEQANSVGCLFMHASIAARRGFDHRSRKLR
jgi:hypothetical protein